MKNFVFGIFVLLLCSIDFADAASANMTVTATVLPTVSITTTEEGYPIIESSVSPDSYQIQRNDLTIEVIVK